MVVLVGWIARKAMKMELSIHPFCFPSNYSPDYPISSP